MAKTAFRTKINGRIREVKTRSFIHSNNFTVIHGNGMSAFYFTEKYYSGNIITTKQTKHERNKRSTHMAKVLSLSLMEGINAIE